VSSASNDLINGAKSLACPWIESELVTEFASLKLNATSSAVISPQPSWNITPFRRLKVPNSRLESREKSRASIGLKVAVLSGVALELNSTSVAPDK